MHDVLIRSLQRHDALSADDIAAVEALPFQAVTYPAGAELVEEGSRPTRSCLMLDGMTARCNILLDGRRQISAVHMQGDFVDLHGFLLDRMDHCVIALSDVRVAFIPHPALRRITETEPHVTRLLWLLTLIDAATHRQWLTATGRLMASEQLARFLCEMLRRHEAIGLADGRTFALPMSQTVLGDALGLSPVHVNRTVQDLRRRGLIAWNGTSVTVLDRPRLEELGEFDPSYLNLDPRPR